MLRRAGRNGAVIAMRTGHHLYLFYLATTFWALFYLGGLPSNYYQDWPWPLSLVVILVLPSMGFLVLVRQLSRGLLACLEPRRVALWAALYMTLPLLVYDLIYLGWHERRGLHFVVTHWYLSAFYVIPWLLALVAPNRLNSRGQ